MIWIPSPPIWCRILIRLYLIPAQPFKNNQKQSHVNKSPAAHFYFNNLEPALCFVLPVKIYGPVVSQHCPRCILPSSAMFYHVLRYLRFLSASQCQEVCLTWRVAQGHSQAASPPRTDCGESNSPATRHPKILQREDYHTVWVKNYKWVINYPTACASIWFIVNWRGAKPEHLRIIPKVGSDLS